MTSTENQVTVVWNHLKIDWKPVDSKLISIQNQVTVNWNQLKVIWKSIESKLESIEINWP